MIQIRITRAADESATLAQNPHILVDKTRSYDYNLLSMINRAEMAELADALG
jgi:hypothetical protein